MKCSTSKLQIWKNSLREPSTLVTAKLHNNQHNRAWWGWRSVQCRPYIVRVAMAVPLGSDDWMWNTALVGRWPALLRHTPQGVSLDNKINLLHDYILDYCELPFLTWIKVKEQCQRLPQGCLHHAKVGTPCFWDFPLPMTPRAIFRAVLVTPSAMTSQ